MHNSVLHFITIPTKLPAGGARRGIYFGFPLFFLSIGSLFAQTKMSSSEADALRILVKDQAAVTKTIASDFTQYKHMDFLSNDIESTGKLSFKAPDLVKWE